MSPIRIPKCPECGWSELPGWGADGLIGSCSNPKCSRATIQKPRNEAAMKPATEADVSNLLKLVKAVRLTDGRVELLDVDGKDWLDVAEPYRRCKHERLNDHGDACLDCGAVIVFREGWQ